MLGSEHTSASDGTMAAERDLHNKDLQVQGPVPQRDLALARWLMGAVMLTVLIGIPGSFVASALPQLEIRIGSQPVPPYTIVVPAIFFVLIVAPVVAIFWLSARKIAYPSSLWKRARVVGVIGLALALICIFPIIVTNSAEAVSYSAAASRGPTAEEASYTPEELEFVAQEVALDSVSTLGGVIPEEPSNSGSIACETSDLQPGTEYLSDITVFTTDPPEVVQSTLEKDWKRFGAVSLGSTSASWGDGGVPVPWVETSGGVMEEMQAFILGGGEVRVHYSTICVAGEGRM
jgi:hypothetical protein